MQESTENMCIICFAPRKSNFSCLYKKNNILSDIGILYQDLLQTSMMVLDRNIKTPRYICCDCGKQIKSFNRFKKKVIGSYRKILKSICTNEMESSILDNFIKIEEITIIDANTEKETEKFQIKYLNDGDDDDSGVCIEETTASSNGDVKVENIQQKTIPNNLSKKLKTTHKKSDNLNKITGGPCKQQQYFCHNCKLLFEDGESYEAHRTSAHPHQVTCQICYRTFDSEVSFNEHLNNDHSGLTEYRCNECGKAFSSIAIFLSHITISHKDSDTTCTLCGKTFPKKSLLMVHKKVHFDERPYECEVCGKRFRSSSHRKYHRYSHMAKQFQCELCFQMYSTPRTLNDHMKYVHLGQKPYTCDICRKSFQRKSKMNEHRGIHFR